jgi:hypothetical protein
MTNAARIASRLGGMLMGCALGALPVSLIATAAEAQMVLGWAGQDEDQTGAYQVKPDGSKDGHFRVIIKLPSPAEVRSLVIYSSTPEGVPSGGQVWHSAGGNYWVAGVFNSGKALNQTQAPSMGRFSGETMLDVYCSDSGWFKPKNHFLVEVELGSGDKLRAVTQITDGPMADQPVPAAPGAVGLGAAATVEVSILAYGKDESDGSEVGWDTLYPHPSFDDDPGRRGLPNAKWTGAHWWQGNNLCLGIKNLEAPWPPTHRLAIGYTVTLGSGRFADGSQSKTFVLYRYSAKPGLKDIAECHPVTEWTR